MTLLSLSDVRFGYAGEDVLNGVSLRLENGEAAALLGANGAGKTTLLKLAMAFHHPRAGVVSVDGRVTSGLEPEMFAGTVGYLFQRPEDQLFRRTVRDDVAFGPAQLGWGAARVLESVRRVLEELELSEYADRHPYDLSLPRRRLVALAGVLAGEPKLLLLDEPTATLDRGARALVVRVLRARREQGAAFIAVTHDTAFALEACDRGILLDAGVVKGDGPIATVLGRSGGTTLPPTFQLLARLGVTPRTPRWGDLAAALAERCRDLQ